MKVIQKKIFNPEIIYIPPRFGKFQEVMCKSCGYRNRVVESKEVVRFSCKNCGVAADCPPPENRTIP